MRYLPFFSAIFQKRVADIFEYTKHHSIRITTSIIHDFLNTANARTLMDCELAAVLFTNDSWIALHEDVVVI